MKYLLVQWKVVLTLSNISVIISGKTMFGSSLHPVICRRFQVLFTLFVLFVHSGVQHILCCVFVLFVFVTTLVLIDTDCAGCCTIYHSITTTPLLEKELYCKHKHIYCWHNTSLSTLTLLFSLTFVYEISKVRKLKRVIFFNLYFKWDTIKFRLRRIIIRLICQEVINTYYEQTTQIT
jgi:hypothetical protein